MVTCFLSGSAIRLDQLVHHLLPIQQVWLVGTVVSYCTSPPELLSRYPLSDHSEFPLSPSVSLFCLPFGVSVELWDRHASFPLPTFSTFALTGATGQCVSSYCSTYLHTNHSLQMYGACIVFYEPVLSDCSAIHEMRSTLQASDNVSIPVDRLVGTTVTILQAQLHMNKCVCVLSHWPFFSAFKSFLSALYRLSLSKDMPLPLERYGHTLWSHCSHTVVTLLTRCGHTVVTLLTRFGHTAHTLWSHCSHTVVTLLTHCGHTAHTLWSHCCRYVANLMLDVPFPSYERPRVQMLIGVPQCAGL